MGTARIDIRVSEEIKRKIEKASVLSDSKSVTDYIVRLVEADATEVIKRHETMTVEKDVFDRFMEACENAEPPNQNLRDAVAFSESLGF